MPTPSVQNLFLGIGVPTKSEQGEMVDLQFPGS